MSIEKTVGRRKAAVARVFLKKGKGQIIVNGRDYKEYFSQLHFREKVEQPLTVIETKDYDFYVNVQGGGLKGQADAIKLAIARALAKANPDERPKLKAAKLLTRDPRVVERKKAGLRKARKRTQFSKR
ncbi:MAG: 30S ribosomal protein S9 [Chitinophagales bacterium]|nr:MAG: 30S ribosomal protein S9 [Chitinophagales bacterium]